MDSSRPIDSSKLLTLQEAANVLAVSIDVLLRWNDHQILKPTITQTGQIGYTQAQIDQFMRIQQSLRTAKPQIEKAALSPTEPFSRFTSQPSTYPDQQPTSTQLLTNAVHSNKVSSVRFFSYATVIATVLVIAVLAQQGQFNNLIDQYEKTYQQRSTSQANILGPQTSSLELAQPLSSAQPVALNKNSQEVTGSAFTGKTPNPLFVNKQHATVSTQQYPSPTASVAGVFASRLAQKGQAQNPTDMPTFANTTTQATNTTPNSLFDKSGNISGKTSSTDELAMNVGGAGFPPNRNLSNPENTDQRNQFVLIVTIASGMILFLVRKPRKVIPATQLNHSDQPSRKLLEIDQKMDGTVVLYFQGKDYKISKPELHSDSDRFFERLMEIVGPGVKEIEYDNYNDDKMRLSTPLSRLVTRLGFVGIKRDLFFPRTSKHNVLFRKYITHEDLSAMHLTPDQVAKDLLQTFQGN